MWAKLKKSKEIKQLELDNLDKPIAFIEEEKFLFEKIKDKQYSSELLTKIQTLICELDKEEDKNLETSEKSDNVDYYFGLASGYGICAEKLRNIIK